MTIVKFIVLVSAAYFIGNISPSIIMGKLKGINIKEAGSGNAGTTNALRVLGKKAALVTLVVDILKGTFSVYLGMHFGNQTIGMVCALAVFCGHIWPCFYGFKGGKGVATAFGALLGVNWVIAVLALLIAAAGLAATKRMSVGSLLAAVTFPVICLFIQPDFIWIGSLMAVIIVIKHRGNIIRLIKGEEPKMFGNKGKDNE